MNRWLVGVLLLAGVVSLLLLADPIRSRIDGGEADAPGRASPPVVSTRGEGPARTQDEPEQPAPAPKPAPPWLEDPSKVEHYHHRYFALVDEYEKQFGVYHKPTRNMTNQPVELRAEATLRNWLRGVGQEPDGMGARDSFEPWIRDLKALSHSGFQFALTQLSRQVNYEARSDGPDLREPRWAKRLEERVFSFAPERVVLALMDPDEAETATSEDFRILELYELQWRHLMEASGIAGKLSAAETAHRRAMAAIDASESPPDGADCLPAGLTALRQEIASIEADYLRDLRQFIEGL